MIFKAPLYQPRYSIIKDWKLYSLLIYGLSFLLVVIGHFIERSDIFGLGYLLFFSGQICNVFMFHKSEVLMGNLKGELVIDEESITFCEKDFSFAEINVLKFSAKHTSGDKFDPIYRLKLSFRPNISNGSGNFIEFEYGNEKYRLNFILTSLKKKREFENLVGILTKKGFISCEDGIRNLEFYNYESIQEFKTKYCKD